VFCCRSIGIAALYNYCTVQMALYLVQFSMCLVCWFSVFQLISQFCCYLLFVAYPYPTSFVSCVYLYCTQANTWIRVSLDLYLHPILAKNVNTCVTGPLPAPNSCYYSHYKLICYTNYRLVKDNVSPFSNVFLSIE